MPRSSPRRSSKRWRGSIPTDAADYEARRAAFLARLHAKLGAWQAALAPLKGMPIVAYHNSWPYFARRFRLDFLDFIETKPGVPPSPAHLAGHRSRRCAARGARIVVREPHEPERDVAFVAGKAGATIVTLAASVGALPAASDYLALFDADVDGARDRRPRRNERRPRLPSGRRSWWPSASSASTPISAFRCWRGKVIFVDLALAQVAALGATVAFMLGHPAQGLAAYGYSLAFTLARRRAARRHAGLGRTACRRRR